MEDLSLQDTVACRISLVSDYVSYSKPYYIKQARSIVDPHKESGQNLYRQYVGKKGKIVLDARWVHECVKAGALQTFHSNWADCKVLGTELFVLQPRLSSL